MGTTRTFAGLSLFITAGAVLLWPADEVRCCSEAESFLKTALATSSRGHKQLFLDDRGIEKLVGLHRTLHHVQKLGPVIRPDRPWESIAGGSGVEADSGPSWNPEKKLWMMWYDAGSGCAYATSHDLIRWEKPVLGARVFEGSAENNLLPNELYSIFYDQQEPNPDRRYKGFLMVSSTDKPPAGWKWNRTLPSQTAGLFPAVSPDGVHWKILEASFIPSSDEFRLFYDAKRKLYVATVKQFATYGRAVHLVLSRDFEHWTDSRDCLIFYADKRDQGFGARLIRAYRADPALRHPVLDKPEEYKTDVYNFSIFPYEQLYIAMPTLFNQSANTNVNSDGLSMTELAVSRDLVHWTRVDQGEKFIPLSPVEGEKNYDIAQIGAANYPVIQGGEIWFFYTGAKWRVHPIYLEHQVSTIGQDCCAVCLAKLRLDGFVSLDAGSEGGAVVTKPLTVDGRSLHINVQAQGGEVRAEVLDAATNQALPGFSAAESIAAQGDHLDAELRWRHSADLASLSGRSVRLRFLLRNGSLYSFWLRP